MTTPNINHDSWLAPLCTGLSFRWLGKISDDGLPRNMSGSTLQAQVLSADRSKAYTPLVDLVDGGGAAWAQGRVLVEIPATATTTVPPCQDVVLAIYETAGADKWGHFFPLRSQVGLPNG